LPTGWYQTHMDQSPSSPYSLVEFQGGAFDPWGGVGFTKCAALLNHEFERVFYKNNLSFRAAFLNLYMVCCWPWIHWVWTNIHRSLVVLTGEILVTPVVILPMIMALLLPSLAISPARSTASSS
jgi:hypothetical protein